MSKWNGLCPAGKHGLDFREQPCGLCAGRKVCGHCIGYGCKDCDGGLLRQGDAMTRDEIVKLYGQCSICNLSTDLGEKIDALLAAEYRRGMECAAEICDEVRLDGDDDGCGYCDDLAAERCADLIREEARRG